MPLETSKLYQVAVLWPAEGINAYGETTVGVPEEIRCRWEFTHEEVPSPTGGVIALAAIAAVAQDIKINSLMWLGSLENWYGIGSAGDDSEVMQVVTFKKSPDLRNVNNRREVGLIRHKDTPTA